MNKCLKTALTLCLCLAAPTTEVHSAETETPAAIITAPTSIDNTDVQELRSLYGQAQSAWPSIVTSDGRKVPAMAPLKMLGSAPNPNRVALGRALFFDPILSRDQTVSCASCHEARLHFGDRRRVAIGIEAQQGKRNTPNILGIDHWQSFFWDGRAKTALEQAIMPIQDPLEMDLPIATAVNRINNSEQYPSLLQKAYGSTAVTPLQLAQALVAFQRTITLPDTQFSRFIERARTSPKEAVNILSETQLQGLHLFRTKAKCMTCHNGPLLSDNQFHVTGLHFYGRLFQDTGRYDVTGNIKDSGKFRTPSILLASHTGPWMHNGLFEHLDSVVNFYNNGGARPKPRKHVANDPLYPKTTDLLVRLDLSKEEIADIVAFLEIL